MGSGAAAAAAAPAAGGGGGGGGDAAAQEEKEEDEEESDDDMGFGTFQNMVEPLKLDEDTSPSKMPMRTPRMS